MTTRKTNIAVLAVFALVFALLLAGNCLSPLTADDFLFCFSRFHWSRITGVDEIFPSLAALRQNTNGRVFAHFFVQLFLLEGKAVFNVVNALMGTLLFYILYRYIRRGERTRDLLLLLFEVADGIILCPPFLFKNEIQVCQPVHFIFDPDDILAVQVHSGETDKHAVADGVLNPDPLVGIEVAERQQHHKTQGTLIDPAPFLIFQGQGDQRAVLAELVIQLADHAAGLGGKRTHGKSVQRFQARSDCSAFREFFFVVHGTDNHIVTLLSTICRVCLHYDLYHPYYR